MNLGGVLQAFVFDPLLFDHFIIKGESMIPTLRPGQRINQANLLRIQQLRSGDLHVFMRNNQLLIHRFVGKKRDSLIFIGDNCILEENVDRNSIVAHLPLTESYFNKRCICLLNFALISIPMKLRRPFFNLKKIFLERNSQNEKRIC
jgi:signal peptidase I